MFRCIHTEEEVNRETDCPGNRERRDGCWAPAAGCRLLDATTLDAGMAATDTVTGTPTKRGNQRRKPQEVGARASLEHFCLGLKVKFTHKSFHR